MARRKKEGRSKESYIQVYVSEKEKEKERMDVKFPVKSTVVWELFSFLTLLTYVYVFLSDEMCVERHKLFTRAFTVVAFELCEGASVKSKGNLQK